MKFFDLLAQDFPIKDSIEARINKVISHGQFIMGPEVRELEESLTHYLNGTQCVTCGNGTDALQLALIALGIGEGDIVFTTAFSFFATAEVIASVGASPYFVDIDEATFNISADQLELAIAECATSTSGTPKALIVVDIFGLPADYERLQSLCNANNLRLIADGAQSFGAQIAHRKAGSFGDIATTSFFPAKPLGCYGDGGAVFSKDNELLEIVRSLRIHGKGKDKYDNIRIGMNSRLDTIQAAVLLEKLPHLAQQIQQRDQIITRYKRHLSDKFRFQHAPEGYVSAHAQCSLMCKAQNRSTVLERLQQAQIPYQIYYPTPLNKLPPMQKYPAGDCSVTEKVCRSVFSIPCHSVLNDTQIDNIIQVLSDLS